MPSLSGLEPEAQLLFLCAAGAAADAEIASLVAGPLDWGRVGGLAVKERAVPVLWQRLRPWADALPRDERTQMDRLSTVYRFRALRLEHRLFQVIDLLAANGIPVVLLKGAALALTVYDAFWERPMGDVDLLLRDGDAARARALLRAAGWQNTHAAEREAFYDDHHHLAPLDDQDGLGMGLELHTRLAMVGHPFGLDAERVWQGAVRIERKGRTLLVPRSDHQIIHLCLHFAWSHAMQGSGWRTFRDLQALTGGPEMDWDGLVALAHETGARTCCYWTFRLASAVGALSVPERVLESLRPPLPAPLLTHLERHFLRETVPSAASCPSVWLNRKMWEAGIRPRWSGHGTTRPWDRDEVLVPEHGGTVAERRQRGLIRHLHNWSQWRRYFGALLGGGRAQS